MFEAEDACLKCTLCVSACPVYRVDFSFPGPKALGPEWYRRRLAAGAAPDPGADACTFCLLCEAACPVGVPIAHLIAEQKRLLGRSRIRRWRDAVLARPHRVAQRAGLVARIPAPVKAWVGIAREARLPVPRRPSRLPVAPPAVPRARVAIYVDCYTRGFDPALVEETRALLGIWGYEAVAVPEAAVCCGAAAYAAGRPDLAARLAGEAARALVPRLKDVQALVTLNATCDETLRQEWPRYFGLDTGVAVVPFPEFALSRAPAAFWAELAALPPETVFVHHTCRSQGGSGEGSIAELARRAGARAVPLDLPCCGAGGSYAFKEEHAAVAFALADRARPALEAGPGPVLLDSGTCGLHLEQVSAHPAEHPARWLWGRYRRIPGGGGQEGMSYVADTQGDPGPASP